MAMTKCRECGEVVSADAEACPKCGAKNPGLFKHVFTFLFTLFAMAIWYLYFFDRPHWNQLYNAVNALFPK